MKLGRNQYRIVQPANLIGAWSVLVCVGLCSSLLTAQDRSPNPQPTDKQPSPEELDFFEKRIRPVLVEHCYECHSAKAKKTKGGLRLDHRQGVLRGGETGPAIVPGQPSESLLISAVRYESIEMPPSGKLPEGVIADLVRWIEMGAPDPRIAAAEHVASSSEIDGRDHWAFQPVTNPARPDVADRSWPLSDVDYFILARLEREGLKPAPDADRATWLRRVSFDLTGLPPTVEELAAFLQDESPSAFEAVVDRLLASRGFGERWARHWLDLVGYADQFGAANNLFAEHGWRYRDYVIDAFHNDKPFDEFIREQIAGDLLPSQSVEDRAENLIATGYLVLGDIALVEADKAKLHVDVVDQQVDKIGKAFLGMTLGCARCHDHKFDPISQHDYYAMGGFFHGTASVYVTGRGVWSDIIAVELPENETQRTERAERTRCHVESIAAMRAEREKAAARKRELEAMVPTQSASEGGSKDSDAGSVVHKKELDELKLRIAQLDRSITHAEFFMPAVPKTYGVHDVEQPTAMRITIRGNPRALGDEAPRGFLSAIAKDLPAIPTGTSGRLQLADWIASPDHPLTARVAVNRIWQKLFGAGLVRSVDYFGLRGETPTHPELFDFIAGQFVREGWSQKRMVRDLVLSRAYRQSTAHDTKAHAADPDNRLLWRMNRRRLDAEALRDALLAVSGKLQLSHGGPAMPLEYPENVQNLDPKSVNPPSFVLRKFRPNQSFVRTIYLPVLRSDPQPGPAELRNVFDFTQPAEFTGQRATTAVPTQALFLMNSSEIKDRARELADRVARESDGTAVRLDLLWRIALGRPIAAEEKREAESFLAAGDDGAWVELCHAVLASNEFLMQL